MVRRIKTGIAGLDELLEGGIPEGFRVFLSGGPGAGKSIFGMQYLWTGALQQEKGIYVSLEENLDNLFAQAKEFGWDFERRQNDVKFITYTLSGQYQYDIMQSVLEEARNFNAKRLVFDSINAYLDFTLPKLMKDQYFKNAGAEVATRYATHLLIDNFSTMPALTPLLINEETDKGNVAEFMTDGVIALRTYAISGKTIRQLVIPKMRLTNQDTGNHTFDFTNKGITLSTSLR